MNTSDPSPLPLRVRLPFTSEEEFIRRFGSNLSSGGIFIPTKALKPEGTQLRFEVVLTDGTRLLRGGVVVQRAIESAPGQRGGMELAFTELDGPSHALLERVLLAREVRPKSALVSVGPLLSGRMRSTDEAEPPTPQEPQVAPSHPEPQAPVQAPPVPREPSGVPGPALDEAPAPPAPVTGSAAGRPVPEEGAQQARPEAREQQRSARAERVEGLARASAEGIGELVARARQQEAVTVVSFCFDHLEAGIGRIEAGRFQHVPLPHAPARSPVLRLLARQADAPRLLELASGLGLQPGDGADGFADWDDGEGRVDGTTRAARWLEEIAAGADALSADEPRRPVLALPLHAGHLQRQLWHDAAARVGIDNLVLVSTPVAAAIAYAQGRGFARRRLLVLSLSEVGFDAAVVQITGDDVETLSAAGDPYLGTAEFDARMAFGIRQRLRLRGLLPPEPTTLEGRALAAACANARRELAGDAHTTFEITAREHDGSPVPFTVEFTRDDVDAPVHDLVERIVGLVREVLDGAKLNAGGVDDVLVLGRTGHSPLLRRRLSELLDRSVGDSDEEPDALIVRGAALFGEAQLRAEQGRAHLQAAEVLTVPLAVVERTGALRRVLDRGTRLPVSKSLSLPGDPGVTQAILVHQGGPERADADFLGAAICTPTMPGGIEVHFRVARDGRVAVELLPPRGGSVSLSRTPLSAEQLAELIALAPEGAAPSPDGGGLLGGLRRLFRKV